MDKSKKPSSGKPFSRLLRLFPQKHLLIFGIIIAIFHAGITIFFGYLLKLLIDSASFGDRDMFYRVVIISVISLVLNSLFIYFRTKLVGSYTEHGLKKLRAIYSEKVTALKFEVMAKKHSGELLSIGTNDMNNVRNFTYTVIPRLIEVPLTSLLALIVVLYLSWQLTLFSLVMLPVLIFGTSLLLKPIGSMGKKVQERLGKVNSVSVDYIKGVEVAKAYTLETPLKEKHDAYVDESIKVGKQLVKRRAFLGAFSEGFSIIPFITTFIFGGYLVIQGDMTAGSLLAFINLLNFLTWPLSQLSVLLGDAKRDLASASRIFDLIDAPLERDSGKHLDPVNQGDVISFKDVSFTYPGDEKPVIKNLNLTVKKGESIAFVGPSGGGKSTVTKLLMGYYDDFLGEINILGHALNDWHLNALRSQLSLVSQDTFLFPESIYENIAHGKLGASKEEVKEVLIKANAYTFVEALDEGMDTLLSELGDSLSGGQKQRLSIARALIKDAPILLLDEATSALDSEAEALIQETLETVLKDKTSIIIAHRLSTIKFVDRICVLDQGTLVESGTHEELLKLDGVYKRLYLKEDLGGGLDE
ncbi:MAG: ABC transporter ATP-binding protein [Candidatus Izemoplasmataceae bacterium]